MAGRPRVRGEALDVEAIVAAALKLSRKGLARLTMRSLSAELQVSVGALYKHVSGREELLDLVVDHVLVQAPRVTAGAGDSWLALRARVLGIQALMDRHPGLDEAVIARSSRSPVSIEVRREGIAALQQEGLSRDDAQKVCRAVVWLWLGSRIGLEGRKRVPADIAAFTDALDILIAGLRHQLADSVATTATPTHNEKRSPQWP